MSHHDYVYLCLRTKVSGDASFRVDDIANLLLCLDEDVCRQRIQDAFIDGLDIKIGAKDLDTGEVALRWYWLSCFRGQSNCLKDSHSPKKAPDILMKHCN